MEFRKAISGDSEELIKLIQLADDRTKEIATAKVNKFVDNKTGFFILAIEKQKIIGYLLFLIETDDENAEKFLNPKEYSAICWIAVHPEYRALHVGSKLLKEAEKYTKGYNKKGLCLDCREDVVEFYKKNNYVLIGNYSNPTKSGKIKPSFVFKKDLK